jgi:uncharacterized protein (TIGR02996 family)
MSERDAFLSAIAASPADDTVRLAFADWLDEHDEPKRAEFIRIQIKLGDTHRDEPHVEALAERERALFATHEAEWLGPLKKAEEEGTFSATIRRGFVDAAVIYGRAVRENADALRAHCPVLREVDVVGVRGWSEDLANAPFLNSVRTLRLEDWPYPDDAKALARSPHLSHLEELSFWLGSRNDEAVCTALGSSTALPALELVTAVRLRGGMTAGSAADELAARADRSVAIINALRGRTRASVSRPFEDLFPLADQVGREMYGGTLPDGRRVLVCGGRVCDLLYFDASDRLTAGDERLDLSAGLTRTPPQYQDHDRAELMAVLAARIGFTPGTIRVHEFNASTVIPNHWCTVYKFGGTSAEVFEDPDEPPPPYDTKQWEEALESIRHWLRSDDSCITTPDECWADESGTIHTT